MRKAALAAGGFALVLALTGCGGNSIEGSATTFGSAQELVRAAKAGTEKTQTAKFSLDGAMGAESVKATGEGRFEANNPAMSMKMDQGGQTMEMRFVDNAMYIKGVQEMADAPGMQGKEWLKVSGEGDDPLSRMLGPMFEQMGKQMDVSKQLEQIRQAGTIKKSEQAELDGQPTTHYWLDLDTKKAMEQQMPEGLPPQMLEEAKKQLANAGPIPMELWVNEQQLPVQIVVDMSSAMKAMGAPAGQAGGKMTMKYTDWGAPVDVTAPPADKVGELKMPR